MIIRVYRDDNNFYQASDCLAIVDNKYAYLVNLLAVQIPEWVNAKIEIIQPIFCPEPGLFNNTTGALEGWQYLLDTEHIVEIKNQVVLEQHIPGENAFVVGPEHRVEPIKRGQPGYVKYEREKEERQGYAKGILETMERNGVLLPMEYDRIAIAFLAPRFLLKQLQDALIHVQAGEEIFFQFCEWGEA